MTQCKLAAVAKWFRFEKDINMLYVCEYCENSFDRKQKLNRHIRFSHTNVHECPKCSRTFACLTDILRHVAIVHERKKRLECFTCGKEFTRKSTLNQHIATMHDEQNNFDYKAFDYNAIMFNASQ